MDTSFITIALKRLGDQVVDRLQQQLETDDTILLADTLNRQTIITIR